MCSKTDHWAKSRVRDSAWSVNTFYRIRTDAIIHAQKISEITGKELEAADSFVGMSAPGDLGSQGDSFHRMFSETVDCSSVCREWLSREEKKGGDLKGPALSIGPSSKTQELQDFGQVTS